MILILPDFYTKLHFKFSCGVKLQIWTLYLYNEYSLKFCFKFLMLEVCITCYVKKTCICTVGQMWVQLFLSKQFLILSLLPNPLNVGLKWDSKFEIIDNVSFDIKTCIGSVGWIWVHLLMSQWSLIFTSIIWSPEFGFSSDILKLALLITCYDIKTSIWYRPDVGASLYIKAIFDFCLNYLIQNLNFEERLATWRSCYITHIVANLCSSTYNLMF